MMMTIDVRKCNAQKKYAGDLTGEFEADDALIDIPYVRFFSPVRAELHYEILEDDSVEVTGTLFFALEGACSRCLAQTEQKFEGSVDACFVPQGGESEEYRYRNGVVDLQSCLNDALILALPGRLVCEPPCVALEWNEK